MEQSRIIVRAFTFPSDLREEHSYCVGCRLTSLSPSLGTISIDEHTTFDDARYKIEVLESVSAQHMRRNIIFQEFLQIAANAANPHAWPEEALQTYWFGRYVEGIEPHDGVCPEIILACDETQPLVDFYDMKTTKAHGHLIIIPQSQIGPVCGHCCRGGCGKCPDLIL